MSKFDYMVVCRHVASETSLTACQIQGTVPGWLQGFILFNGPGLRKIGDMEYKHAFDASALLQRFVIKDGEVSYVTKYLQSNTFKNNEKKKTISVTEFGTAGSANKGIFARLKNAFDSDKMLSDNACLAVVKMDMKFFAVGESPYFLQIDPVSLQVMKRINMYKNFNLCTQSVHILEEEDGFYTLGQAVSITGPKYVVLHFPKDGCVEKGKVVASINARWKFHPCYIHAMAFTTNYMILIEPPLAVSLMELLSGVVRNIPFIDGLHWQNEPTIFHVFNRSSWKEVSIKYISDHPFFFLHFCNVYEYNHQIVVDISAYKDSSLIHNLFIDRLREGNEKFSPAFHDTFRSELRRFVIPVPTFSSSNVGVVMPPDTECHALVDEKEIHLKSEVLSEYSFENSTRNKNKEFTELGNQFIWGMGGSPKGENFGYIIKIDLNTKETKMFHEEGGYPSPLIFVPTPSAKEEDVGVILALMLTSGKENLVTLLILDAATLTEIGRATAEIKAAVSMPLHGEFFPEL